MSAAKPLVVLFSSAGRRVELLNCFRADAAALGLGLRVVAVDTNPALSAACRAADASYAVPRCLAPEFVPRLLEICAAEKVALVVPTIDTELGVLAEHRARFAAAGVEVAVSSPEVVALARDKAATAAALAAAGVGTPRTTTLKDFLASPAGWEYPLVVKPADGSSSIGLRVLRAPTDLAALGAPGPRDIVQTLCAGEEYTVNMYFDRGGVLRCAVPHRRLETRGGEVSKGVTRRLPVLLEAARQIGAALKGARGALCFQAMVGPDGKAFAFEINARFGGGYPLAHRAGAPFSRWLLEELAGLPSTARDDWREGVLMLRYDAAVFTEGAA